MSEPANENYGLPERIGTVLGAIVVAFVAAMLVWTVAGHIV